MVLRQKFWVDTNVQGMLVGRLVLYWVCALLYVTLGTACFHYYQHPTWTVTQHLQSLFSQFWPWMPGAVLCLPLVIFDVIRLSNAFVGPIFRLRQHLNELCDNPQCPALKFRDDDFWTELVEPIHYLQAEIITLREENAKLKRAAEQAAAVADGTAPAETEQLSQFAKLDLTQAEIGQVKQMLPNLGVVAAASATA